MTIQLNEKTDWDTALIAANRACDTIGVAMPFLAPIQGIANALIGAFVDKTKPLSHYHAYILHRNEHNSIGRSIPFVNIAFVVRDFCIRFFGRGTRIVTNKETANSVNHLSNIFNRLPWVSPEIQLRTKDGNIQEQIIENALEHIPSIHREKFLTKITPFLHYEVAINLNNKIRKDCKEKLSSILDSDQNDQEKAQEIKNFLIGKKTDITRNFVGRNHIDRHLKAMLDVKTPINNNSQLKRNEVLYLSITKLLREQYPVRAKVKSSANFLSTIYNYFFQSPSVKPEPKTPLTSQNDSREYRTGAVTPKPRSISSSSGSRSPVSPVSQSHSLAHGISAASFGPYDTYHPTKPLDDDAALNALDNRDRVNSWDSDAEDDKEESFMEAASQRETRVP